MHPPSALVAKGLDGAGRLTAWPGAQLTAADMVFQSYQ